ncbi:hypothetical protein HGRIS_006949 [Hohenbuehelia grisea]|uniref:FHA domain-containing protein n=1 Tax=Hohenbuehelia grisea TaxID=104357 RepID=A0ABR3JAK2_9AGAR
MQLHSSPILCIYPFDGDRSFTTKRIPLTDDGKYHVTVGRDCTSTTTPTAQNGFFESKVLSRKHAEIWSEHGTIFIKDTKSLNGTYVNGVRLSLEQEESAPHELKNGDVLVGQESYELFD